MSKPDDPAAPDPPDEFAAVTTSIHPPLQALQARLPGRAIVLRQVEGPGAPRDHALTATEFIVGRSGKVDLCIDEPSLSRQHATFERKGSEYVVRDLDSRNGTFLNGVRIHSAVLRGGDSIQTGSAVFVYLEGF